MGICRLPFPNRDKILAKELFFVYNTIPYRATSILSGKMESSPMSEYQRYEFMTCDRPLTSQQLVAVNNLSSHIKASATHALVEYNYGSFKHNPIKVLHQFFDGFLY